MTLAWFWNDYGGLLAFVGAFVLALVINWVATRQSKSIFAVLWGLLPFLLVGCSANIAYQNLECSPPEACEWSGLGYVLAIVAVFGASLIYLVLAVLMRYLDRRLVWQGMSPQISLARDLKTGGFLLGMASLGLLAAIVASFTVGLGLFTRWERLSIPAEIESVAGVPPEKANLPPGVVEAADEILYASSTDVVIQSDQGRVLQARISQSRVDRSQQEVSWEVQNGPPIAQGRSIDRDCSPQMIVLLPPGDTLDRVRSRNCLRAEYFQTEYAILMDGTLWRWRNRIRYHSFLATGILVGPLAGILLGFILTIGAERRRTG